MEDHKIRNKATYIKLDARQHHSSQNIIVERVCQSKISFKTCLPLKDIPSCKPAF